MKLEVGRTLHQSMRESTADQFTLFLGTILQSGTETLMEEFVLDEAHFSIRAFPMKVTHLDVIVLSSNSICVLE